MIKSALRLVAFSIARTESLSVTRSGRLTCLTLTNPRGIHITSPSSKEVRLRGQKVKVGTIKGEILEGESSVVSSKEDKDIFPDEHTPNKLFDGVPFKQLHIVDIKATPNNTVMSVTNYKGVTKLLHSSGTEGFKNAKKGTNVAAQQAAITLGTRTIENGIKTVRVRVQGLGAGRMSAIKGLQMAGLSIVSITDSTRVSWNPLKPRKQRRI